MDVLPGEPGLLGFRPLRRPAGGGVQQRRGFAGTRRGAAGPGPGGAAAPAEVQAAPDRHHEGHQDGRPRPHRKPHPIVRVQGAAPFVAAWDAPHALDAEVRRRAAGPEIPPHVALAGPRGPADVEADAQLRVVVRLVVPAAEALLRVAVRAAADGARGASRPRCVARLAGLWTGATGGSASRTGGRPARRRRTWQRYRHIVRADRRDVRARVVRPDRPPRRVRRRRRAVPGQAPRHLGGEGGRWLGLLAEVGPLPGPQRLAWVPSAWASCPRGGEQSQAQSGGCSPPGVCEGPVGQPHLSRERQVSFSWHHCGRPRGRGPGIHGVRGCLGRRSSPGTWLFPRSPPPRARPSPLAPLVLRNHFTV